MPEDPGATAPGAVFVGYVDVDLQGGCRGPRPARGRQGPHRRGGPAADHGRLAGGGGAGRAGFRRTPPACPGCGRPSSAAMPAWWARPTSAAGLRDQRDQPCLRDAGQPPRPGPRPRRVVQRVRGGGGQRGGRHRLRIGHRRLDPDPGGLLGVASLKTTWGRIPLTGVWPLRAQPGHGGPDGPGRGQPGRGNGPAGAGLHGRRAGARDRGPGGDRRRPGRQRRGGQRPGRRRLHGGTGHPGRPRPGHHRRDDRARRGGLGVGRGTGGSRSGLDRPRRAGPAPPVRDHHRGGARRRVAAGGVVEGDPGGAVGPGGDAGPAHPAGLSAEPGQRAGDAANPWPHLPGQPGRAARPSPCRSRRGARCRPACS